MRAQTWGEKLQDALAADADDAVSPGRAIVAASLGAFYEVPPAFNAAAPPAYTSGAHTYYTVVLGHVFAAHLCNDTWIHLAGEALRRRFGYAEARLARLDNAYFLLTYRM